MVKLAKLVGDTKVELGQVYTPYGDSIKGIRVTIGKVMADHQLYELIEKFRKEFVSNKMVVRRISNTEIHGYSTIATSI